MTWITALLMPSGVVLSLRLLALLAGCFCVYVLASDDQKLHQSILDTSRSMFSRFANTWNWTLILIRQILKSKQIGRSEYAAIAILGVFALAGLLGYSARSSELHANVVDTYYDVYVEANPDGAYNYWLEAHDQFGKPLPRLFLHFCNDFEPEFSTGQNLSILRVEHKFGCVSVAQTHPGYRFARKENGEIIHGKKEN